MEANKSGKKHLIHSWHEAGLVQFGSFKLKSGITSSVYFNFRKLWANPLLLNETCKQLSQYIIEKGLNKENTIIIPLPYAGIPLSPLLSIQLDLPLVLFRKESKSHGTHNTPTYLENPLFLKEILDTKDIDIIFIDDVLTSGTTFKASFPIVVEEFAKHGYNLKNVSLVTLMSRSKESLENIAQRFKEVDVFSFSNNTEVLTGLYEKKHLNDTQWMGLRNEFADLNKQCERNKVAKRLSKKIESTSLNTRISKQFLQRVVKKKTNICLSWDHEKAEVLIHILPKIAENIVALKLHADIYNDEELLPILKQIHTICQQNHIYLIEDRKLSDIGSTVKKQLTNLWSGHYEWIDFVTVHPVSGPGILQAFKDLKEEGVHVPLPIVVEKLSSKGNLCDDSYVSGSRNFSQKFEDILVGYVTQRPNEHNKAVNFTPGVHSGITGDENDQRYHSPLYATQALCTDILIMGRDLMLPPMFSNNSCERRQAVPKNKDEWNDYGTDMKKHIQEILKKIF